jgi:hypothetical protein
MVSQQATEPQWRACVAKPRELHVLAKENNQKAARQEEGGPTTKDGGERALGR